jgi:hypothetical protein
MADRDDKAAADAGLSDSAPHYHGHRERLRSRFREAGAEAVSDYELLELVLFRAIPQRDIKPLAKARSNCRRPRSSSCTITPQAIRRRHGRTSR